MSGTDLLSGCLTGQNNYWINFRGVCSGSPISAISVIQFFAVWKKNSKNSRNEKFMSLKIMHQMSPGCNMTKPASPDVPSASPFVSYPCFPGELFQSISIIITDCICCCIIPVSVIKIYKDACGSLPHHPLRIRLKLENSFHSRERI